MTNLTYNEPAIGIIRPATHEDCLIIGNNLRQREAMEIWGYDNSLPVEGVTKSFNKSVVKMTIEHDGVPVCLFGIMLINGIATLWLMPTDQLSSIGRIFVRNTKLWLKKMLENYPILVAYVDFRNDESKRWLRWVGGKECGKVFMGISNSPFIKFEFRKD